MPFPHRLAVLVPLLLFAASASGAEPDFSRDVLPILAEQCFHCHGPDATKRSAGLRLDTREGAFRTKNGVTTIVPGKADESELVRRIHSADAEEMMPPPDSNRKLSANEKAILKNWIAAGAKWGKHWSFEPRKVSPGIAGIDAFVANHFKANKLVAVGEATPEQWLRRVSFDLSGLPPTVSEVDAYLVDHTKNPDAAREAVVERLFKSPRYAERMATDWLDVARFADTHGYQADRRIAVWPYRDWVLKAFQANLPFDSFLREQLAGDLLPNATKDQRVATAFNRLHMQNEEGGVVEEEFRVAYVVDRVNTMGTAFLGMTFECCRCHDHKYDPLSQKDYYSLFAFFQNIDESGQTSHFTNATPVPALPLTTPDQDRKLNELRQEIVAREASLRVTEKAAAGRFARRSKTRPKELPKSAGLVASYTFDDKSTIANGVDPKKPGHANDGPMSIPGVVGTALQLNGDNGVTLPGVAHFTRDDAFGFAFWVKVEKHLPRMLILHHSKAPIDAGSRGYDVLLEDGHVSFGLYHMWPGNALKVQSVSTIPTGEWVHVTVSYDGSSSAAGARIYLNGAACETTAIRDRLTKDITYGGDEPSLAVGFRFRDNGLKNGAIDELQVFQRRLTALDAAHRSGKPTLTAAYAAGDEALLPWYIAAIDAESADARKALHDARAAWTKLMNPIPDVMVMEELSKPKPAFLLKRGTYDAPGEAVAADVPGVMPAFPKNQPRNRLGLANWLTHPDHPLTARVAVNRLWQQMFGKGLVETSDNFGTTGTVPTHPELLDFLADDFVRHGWNIQRTLKMLALSATYRRSSKSTAELRTIDPYNLALARFPVRRLTAEMLRDQSLFASGLLVETLGGPSVFPYQPEGVWADAGGDRNYPQSTGSDLYRRSLYTVWKRTAPHPQMTTFDAADRSVCSARRQSTSTPLQALALLNDPQHIEAARVLACKLIAAHPTAETRLATAFRTIVGRAASEKETAILLRLHKEQRDHYRKHPTEAETLLKAGAAPKPTGDAVEPAALTIVVQAVLNHDEAVNRR